MEMQTPLPLSHWLDSGYQMYFAKPKELEGRTLVLSEKQKREQLERKCHAQRGQCYWCGIAMTRDFGHLRTATRDHLKPQPMGCAKDERDSNIVAACWYCNYQKGSRRPA